jgi:parallel beta-helix repeat protein
MAPLRLLPVIALLVLSGVTAAAGQSPPAGLECGDTITADTTLDRDLTGCPSNGLLIGADDITLDLNGHTISGDGKPVRRCPRRQPCDFGVLNERHDGVTVRNGSLRGFGVGVLIGGVRDNRLVELSSSRNQYFGYVIADSSRSVIRDSSATDNPRPDGDGLGVFVSHDLRIVGNEFRRNGQIGIHIEKSTGNLIKGNEFVDNGDFGIFVQANGNQIRGNRCVRGGAGILVGPGSRNVIAGNRVSRSEEGIAIEKGRGNVVVRNVVAHTRHSGISLGIGDPPIGSTDTLVRGNLVTAAGTDGFLVAKNDRNALLRGNTARRSGDDGFDINSRSARLIGNRAVGSADFEVERL